MTVPTWALMWSLVGGVFAVCKILSLRFLRSGAPRPRLAGYLLAWPGMDARAFLGDAPPPQEERPTAREWLFAGAKLGLGGALLWSVAPWLVALEKPLLAGWFAMVGVAFVLHFGSFHLVSCAWRWAGVRAAPLMDWPIRAESVAEFWGRRWNRAFRDLSHPLIFEPLRKRAGTGVALWTTFLVSGLVHELVISVPAGGGYGGPTLFFLLQAGGMSVERSRWGRRVGLATGYRGWLFSLLAVAGPAVLLFHTPFVRRIILPFMQALGAS